MTAFAIPVLYLAWLLSWFGTFATTCTGSDPKSLSAAMILSGLPYLAAMLFLCVGRLNLMGLILSIPLFPLMGWQAIWGIQLFLVHNIHGGSACTLIEGTDMGVARGGWLEHLYAPYYFLVSVLPLSLIVYSYQRYRRGDRKCVSLGIFD